jgi:hypothetical protein
MAKRIVDLQHEILEMERKADAMQKEYVESTRFLTDEEREKMVDYFGEQARENSDPDDSVDRYLETSYYEVGSSEWTDRELMHDFVSGYSFDLERLKDVPLWRDVLSRNLAAVAVMGEFLEQQEGA